MSRTIGVAARALLLLALVASGVGTVLQLSRWEWSRAMFMGLAFVACLVVLATQLVLSRLDALEARLDAGVPATPRRPRPDGTGTASLPATAPLPGTAPARPFPWLEEPQRLHIFLPVVLAFGVGLSVVAAVAERVAGLLAGGRPARKGLLRGAVALLAVAAVLGAAALAYRDGAMTVRVPAQPGTRTYELTVQSRFGGDDDPTRVAGELAAYCATRVHSAHVRLAEPPRAVDADSALLVVTPVLGRFAESAYRGCLSDLVLDRRLVTVDRVSPPPGR